MKKHSMAVLPAIVVLFICTSSLASNARSSGDAATQNSTQKGTAVTKKAEGTFELKLGPQRDENVGDPTISRLSLDKQFSGDLTGTSKGHMLAAKTEVQDSAGYVAMERVNGKLNGRKGTFVLQHSGTMNGGKQQLTISVVPDSGTGDLVGLSGKMTIEIRYGKHFYEFDYSLPNKD